MIDDSIVDWNIALSKYQLGNRDIATAGYSGMLGQPSLSDSRSASNSSPLLGRGSAERHAVAFS